MNYKAEEREPLFENERNRLGNEVKGFGNMVKVSKLSGVSDATIRHAVGGFKLNPDIREKLRNYLKKIGYEAVNA